MGCDMKRLLLAWVLIAAVPAPEIEKFLPGTTPLQLLQMQVTGRTIVSAVGHQRQWPGTYFEAEFEGKNPVIGVGAGEVSLRITVDGGTPIALVRPEQGNYRITGLAAGRHRLRVDVASESQSGPTVLTGLYVADGKPLPRPAPRRRQIEFIGDSHTVGYGNLSTTRDCTQEQVWETTDTSRGPAARTAAKFGADYQVNAISGRGVVRNYAGSPGDTLPQAYPFTLFDRKTTYAEGAWKPQVIVIALGTNDFSTALKPHEPWTSREQLHAAYEQGYVALIAKLRAAQPAAFILLWSTDLHQGEIAAEVAKVAATVNASGDRRVAAVTVHELEMSGCHAHPSVADAARIAEALGRAIDSRSDVWNRELSPKIAQ